MSRKISVCFIIRNGIKQGYPFWESLSSCLPFADQIVISEGHSDDGTADYIEQFRKEHPKLVRLYQDDWRSIRSAHGEVIEKISTRNMRRCSYEWIYYLQADEVIHEDNHAFIRDIAENHSRDFNSVSFRFAHFIGSWTPLEPGVAYDEAIRMVKNDKKIHLIGDAWNFGGGIHAVCPAGLSPKPIYHLGWVFPENNDVKKIEHGGIYLDNPSYQRSANAGRRSQESTHEYVGLPPSDTFDDYPDSVRRLIGLSKYTFPDGVKV